MVDKPGWIRADKSGTSVGTATIAASTDLFTLTAHGLVNGDPVVVDTLTGGAASPVLRTGVVYFVRDVLTNTFAVSSSAGDTPVLFSSDGGAAVYRATPVYDARDLRRLDSALMFGGV